jgi:hypothetical protein
MITYRRKAGSTDVSVVVRLIDSTTGVPETEATFETAGIHLWYRREGEAAIDITEATQTVDGAHSDGGFVHIGDGYYRLDLPDDACDTAGSSKGVLVGGTVTGMVVIGCYIELVSYDPFDGVRAGLTALPNAAADAAGGLPISDAGALDLDAKLANTNEVTAARMGALTDWINGGRLDLLLDAIKAKTDPMTYTVANQLDANALSVAGDTPITETTIADAVAAQADIAAGLATIANLDDTLEDDAGTYRFTTNALEQAPSGGLDAAGVRTAVGLAAADLDDQLAALPTAAEIHAEMFTGNAGVAYAAAHAGSAVKVVTTNASGSGLNAADTRAALGLAAANLDAQLADIASPVKKIGG